MKKTLIFPFGPPGSIEYAEMCHLQGDVVIGASSLAFEPARSLANEWIKLPYCNVPEFQEEFLRAVEENEISEIYSNHSVVIDTVQSILDTSSLKVRLITENGWLGDFVDFRVARKMAEKFHEKTFSCPPLSLNEITSIYFNALKLPGWCAVEKIAAIIDLFPSVPEGDIVEIGVWCGKSASVLKMLSAFHSKGNLLCIDPFAIDNTHQEEDEGVNEFMLQFDMEEVMQHFLCSMQGLSIGSVNYLQLPSHEACSIYKDNKTIESDEFGQTEFVGKIALLHIDGNHDTNLVQQDMDMWVPSVVAGGWIILDDYIHAWGQGPKVIGDRFLESNKERIQTAFVSGSALFIQLD